jgi:ADP-ribosylglycohydrolase
MEPLIISIFGDLISFDSGVNFTYRQRITKSKFGSSFIEKGINYAIEKYFLFLHFGGVNRDLKHHKYSINTIMIYATLKGLINSKKDDYDLNCREEYSKIYKKYSDKNNKFRNILPFNYLNLLDKLDSPTFKPMYDPKANESVIITRIIPIALLFSNKKDRKKMVKQIILNILLTHYNVKCYLSAVTLGLFLSYGKNNIDKSKWAINLVDYLLSDEFETIIKELNLDDDTFVIEKEQYVTMWNEYIGQYLKNALTELNPNIYLMIKPQRRYQYLYYLSSTPDEFAYGFNADDAILCAYDSLLYCRGSWEKMILMGVIGPTDNSTMGTICGTLFGLEYKYESIMIEKYLNEDWIKKTIKLGKSLGL